MSTWADVHVGDVVGGADGRGWTVTYRGNPRTWLGDGATDCKFRVKLGEAEIWTVQPLADPIEIKAYGEHRAAQGAAWSAMTDGGFTMTAIDETTAPPDPFGLPEPAPSQVGLKRKEAPRGKWGWYSLPDPNYAGETRLYPRVTTIAGTLSDRIGLEAWKQRMVAKGIALRPDLIAKASALDVKEDKTIFAEIVKSAMEAAESGAAGNYGTAADKFCERLDCAEPIYSMRIPKDVVPVVEAYRDALKRARLTVLPEYCQRTVVNHMLGYAGTLDRIVRAADGTLYILDLKTGADVLEYGSLEFGPQMWMYAQAQAMCTLDFSGYEPMPLVDTSKALIAHVPFVNPGAAHIYAIDIGPDKGGRAATLAFKVREVRADARKGWMWLYEPASAADSTRLRLQRATSIEDLMRESDQARRAGLWTAELETIALAQYDIVRAGTAQSREALAALWAELEPAGRWSDVVAEVAANRAAALNGGA